MLALERRRFLKVGLAGTLALAAAGIVWRARVGVRSTGASPYRLGEDARAVVAALVPAMLEGVPNAAGPAAIAATVEGVETAIAGLGAAAQGEVADLFALLTLAPSRRLLAGLASPWAVATPVEVSAFLAGWRFSRFALMQQGYAALHDLVLGAWYGSDGAWPTIGYPGPPEVL